MTYIKPSKLVRGDKIAIVAPSSSFDPNKFKKALKVLRSMGFITKYEKEIFRSDWSSPANSRCRARQINRMYADTDIKAVFCAKGGYGAQDIIPFLDKKTIKNNPKIFMGYSDITLLLLYISNICGHAVFHGPVMSGELFEDMNRSTVSEIENIFCKGYASDSAISGLNTIRPGRAAAPVTGGNMTRIIESLEQYYRIRSENRLLFLEDTGESVEQISDYLNKLEKKAVFKNCHGVIFGRISGKTALKADMRLLFENFFEKYDFPVVSGLASGHAKEKDALHIPVPMGIEVLLDADESLISFKESAVV